MGLLDGVLGGVVGAGMVSVVSDIIDKHGGLNGVVNQFHQQGFGDTIKSWIGTGQNMPISPDQLHNALGATNIQAASVHRFRSGTSAAGRWSFDRHQLRRPDRTATAFYRPLHRFGQCDTGVHRRWIQPEGRADTQLAW